VRKEKNIDKDYTVKQCYHKCPFFGISMDGMVCDHPYWKDKKPYENMIITQDNSKNGRIPDKCPLREDKLIQEFKLKEENKMRKEKRVEVKTDLPIETIHKLMEEAHLFDMTLNELVSTILRDYIDTYYNHTIETVIFSRTECYCKECPFHNKTEPFGMCFAQMSDERFKEVCRIIREYYEERKDR